MLQQSPHLLFHSRSGHVERKGRLGSRNKLGDLSYIKLVKLFRISACERKYLTFIVIGQMPPSLEAESNDGD